MSSRELLPEIINAMGGCANNTPHVNSNCDSEVIILNPKKLSRLNLTFLKGEQV